MKQKTLIYVEGLWSTGKTHFISTIKNLNDNDSLLIHNNSSNFGMVKWAQYEMFPLIFKNNSHLFDQSPIMLKVVSDAQLGIYNYKYITPDYWSIFYNEWITALKNSKFDIIFLYFLLPKDDNQTYKEVINHVNTYSNLLINPRKVSPKILNLMNTMCLQSIVEVIGEMKSRSRYYQINYRDTEEAIKTLTYEKLLFQ